MSYDILYDKQFVKLPDNKIIPIILCGSNNVTEVRGSRGPERRSREWWCQSYVLKGAGELPFFADPELILANVQKTIDDTVKENANVKKEWDDHVYTEQEVKDRFGYFTSIAMRGAHTRRSTATMYYNFYKSGIKNAMTIEELNAIGVNLMFSVFEWSSYKFSIPLPKWNRKRIETTEEFYTIYNKVQKYKKECIVTEDKRTFSPSISLYFSGHDTWVSGALKRKRAKERRLLLNQSDTVDYFFTLKNRNGYLYKYTQRGYRYSFLQPMKFFRTEKEAITYKNRLLKNHSHEANSWEIIKINQPHTFVTKVYG